MSFANFLSAPFFTEHLRWLLLEQSILIKINLLFYNVFREDRKNPIGEDAIKFASFLVAFCTKSKNSKIYSRNTEIFFGFCKNFYFMKYRFKFSAQSSDITQLPDNFLLLFLINFHLKKLCLT